MVAPGQLPVATETLVAGPDVVMTAGVFGRVVRGPLEHLPPVVTRFHFGTGDVAGRGTFEVWRSPTRLGRLLGGLLRLPRSSPGTTVSLTIRRPPAEPTVEPVEHWYRRFGADTLDTAQSTDGASLVERSGRAELRFMVAVVGDRLCFTHTGTCLRLGPWSVPVPTPLAPRVEAFVGASPDGRHLHVWVRISFFGAGAVLGYGGHLAEVVEP